MVPPVVEFEVLIPIRVTVVSALIVLSCAAELGELTDALTPLAPAAAVPDSATIPSNFQHSNMTR